MKQNSSYINLVRWSRIIDSFINYYFIRIIVLYLLSNSVTPWVAVSVPIVFEFAKLISRCFKFIINFTIKVNYKKYHIFHMIMFLILGLVISRCRTVYTIYFFTIIMGILSGIKDSSVTKLNTSNKELESYCFIEEERSQVIGGFLGLVTSQYIYDLSKAAYFIGYFVLIVFGTIISLNLKNVENEDVMESIDSLETFDEKEKNNAILVTILFGMLAGLWCISWGAFEELLPLTTNKVGYLNAIYTLLEAMLLFIISGKVLNKIKENGKLMLSETIIALIDTISFLISSIMMSW